VPEKQAQLEWEARAGRLAALAAFVAALAPVASAIALNVILPGTIDNDVSQVKALANNSDAFVVSTAIACVGWLAFIVPLRYLVRTARARIDVPRWIDPLILIGPILLVAALVVGITDIISRSQDVVPGVTKKEAHDLLRDISPAVRGLGAAGALSIAAAFVMVSTYAGRAGLLSRFMSIMGAIIGGLTVFGTLVGAGSLGGPIVLFWGIALGMLFLNRWPGGRGPAWASGEAIPWPSAQDRAQAAREAAGEVPEAESESADDAELEPEPERQPNPRASRKRKKKKARR
jgi:hypothetical protein